MIFKWIKELFLPVKLEPPDLSKEGNPYWFDMGRAFRENPCTCFYAIKGHMGRRLVCDYCKADWKEQLRMKRDLFIKLYGIEWVKENFMKMKWVRAHIDLYDSETEGTLAYYFKRDGYVSMRHTETGELQITNDEEETEDN